MFMLQEASLFLITNFPTCILLYVANNVSEDCQWSLQ